MEKSTRTVLRGGNGGNAISLTRDIPIGLGWLVGPFIENVPRESLDFTLTATREALLKKFSYDAGK